MANLRQTTRKFARTARDVGQKARNVVGNLTGSRETQKIREMLKDQGK